MNKIKMSKATMQEIHRQAAQPIEALLPEDRSDFMASVDDPAHIVEAEGHWNSLVEANEDAHRRFRQRRSPVIPEMGQSESIRIMVGKGDGTGGDKSILLEILSTVKDLNDKFGSRQNLPSDGWMSTEQAANYLMMKPRGVRVAAEAGRLPGHKNPTSKSRGNRWRFKKSELDKYMPSQKRKTSREDISIYQ